MRSGSQSSTHLPALVLGQGVLSARVPVANATRLARAWPRPPGPMHTAASALGCASEPVAASVPEYAVDGLPLSVPRRAICNRAALHLPSVQA